MIVRLQKSYNKADEEVASKMDIDGAIACSAGGKASPFAGVILAGAALSANNFKTDTNKISKYCRLYNLSIDEAKEIYQIVSALGLEDTYTQEKLDILIKNYPDLLHKLYRASEAAPYSTAEINRVYSEINDLFKVADDIEDEAVKEYAFEHHLTAEQMQNVINIAKVQNHGDYKYDNKIKDMQIVATMLY